MISRYKSITEDPWSMFDHSSFPFASLTTTSLDKRNFPPYNIIEKKDGTVVLEMAVAGYTKDRLSIELQDNRLTIQGKPAKETDTYRHKGISNGLWTRSFDMHSKSLVKGVTLDAGILTIEVGIKPEEPASVKTTIPIN